MNISTKCYYCGLSFKCTSVRFSKHLQICHGEILKNADIDADKLVCGSCGRGSFSLRKLITHLTRYHSEHVVSSSAQEDLTVDPYRDPNHSLASQNKSQLNRLQTEVNYDDGPDDHISDGHDRSKPDNIAPLSNVSWSTIYHAASNKFLIQLYGKGSTTRKQVQLTVDLATELMKTCAQRTHECLQHAEDQISTELMSADIRYALDNLRQSIHLSANVFQGLETEHQRMTEWKKQGLVMPTTVTIAHRSDTNPDGSIKLVPVTAQYVSIIDTLEKLTLEYRHPPPDGVFTDYLSASQYKNSAYFQQHPEALPLVLYNDDIELANNLGSKSGIYKLTMFYMSIAGQLNSKLSSIHLVATVHASDIKEYGFNPILKPLVDDLLRLDAGVLTDDNRTIRARLVHVIGDNLAANQIIGMVASFRANVFCRFCYMPTQETRKACRSDSTRRRTAKAHIRDVAQAAQNNESYKESGVKSPCVLDTLPYFSCIEGTVCDIMHDVLEGIGKRELSLLLRTLETEKLITVLTFNDRISNFNFGMSEQCNRPSFQSGFENIRQTSSQAWCLLRFLPLLLGDLVPVGHPNWRVFLLLLDVMDVIFSPSLSESTTRSLEATIEEHHLAYLEAYPSEKLIPKHHFMIHYGEIIRTHGCLSSFWCMRFEGKHRLAKLIANISCNFKNLTLTVAERYQLNSFAQQYESNVDDYLPQIGDVVCISHGRGNAFMKLVSETSGKLFETGFEGHYHAFKISYTEGDESGGNRRKPSHQPDWLDGAGIGYSKVIGDPSNTAQVHPRKLTHAFMNGATNQVGSQVKIGTMVKLNFKESEKPCEGPEKKIIQSISLESGEEVLCDTLILAMGPWTSQAAEWLNYRIPTVTGQRAHSVIVKPKSSSRPITSHALFVNYSKGDGEVLDPEVYPRPDGTVYMCGHSDNTPLPSDTADVVPSQSSIASLYHMLKSLSSDLSDYDTVEEQACFLPVPSGGIPVIGKLPDFPGVYIATGHYCWGILNSAATGKALADLIVKGKSDIDLSPFNPSLHM